MSAPQSPWPEWSATDFSDLDSLGAEYRPEHAFRPGTDTLANGDYDFEVVDAKLDMVGNNRVCRVGLKVNAGGRLVEHTYWLNRKEGINAFGAEMATLGFPAHQWGDGPDRVPLSKAIPECVVKLVGVKFRGTKTSRKDTRPGKQDVVYHDLHVSGRIQGAPMPPISPPISPRTQTSATQPNGPVTMRATGRADDSDQIPF